MRQKILHLSCRSAGEPPHPDPSVQNQGPTPEHWGVQLPFALIHASLSLRLLVYPDRCGVSPPHEIFNADNCPHKRREMETLPCGFYSMFTSCTKRLYALPLCCPSLIVENGLNHFRSHGGGCRPAIHFIMGTNGPGDSWPNVVIVVDKERRGGGGGDKR